MVLLYCLSPHYYTQYLKNEPFTLEILHGCSAHFYNFNCFLNTQKKFIVGLPIIVTRVRAISLYKCVPLNAKINHLGNFNNVYTEFPKYSYI
jgi:hypothetical protein